MSFVRSDEERSDRRSDEVQATPRRVHHAVTGLATVHMCNSMGGDVYVIEDDRQPRKQEQKLVELKSTSLQLRELEVLCSSSYRSRLEEFSSTSIERQS